ncbi:MAG TPA: hypothetical protein VEC35_01755 [Noviherbaspirillum sp.]|nr:hypothetical protein [Noviherbaspirillum sp.]
MATRDLLPVIRAARAGDAAAQVALGRHYLFGGNGLPKNINSALYWLERAARQEVADAWLLIGEHIPYDFACVATDKVALLSWYERAFESGVQRAGLTLARLVLGNPQLRAAWYARAIRILRSMAQAANADAQWLLQQHAPDAAPAGARLSQLETGATSLVAARAKPVSPLGRTVGAADASLPSARRVLAEQAWAVADYTAFLRWSLPLAREVMQRCR